MPKAASQLVPPPYEAEFSPDRKYRYWWSYTWDEGLPVSVFCMLNPSKADEWKTDNTVARCVNYSKMWGHGRTVVINLFPYVATDPKRLYSGDSVALTPKSTLGQARDLVLKNRSSRLVCAWGTHGEYEKAGPRMARYLHDQLNRSDLGPYNQDGTYSYQKDHRCLHILGLTKDGHPRHPLYLKNEIRPTPWPTRDRIWYSEDA